MEEMKLRNMKEIEIYVRVFMMEMVQRNNYIIVEMMKLMLIYMWYLKQKIIKISFKNNFKEMKTTDLTGNDCSKSWW